MVRRAAALATVAVLALALLAPVAAAVGHCTDDDCAPAPAECCEAGCGLCECCAPAVPGLDDGAAAGELRTDGAGLAPPPLGAPAVPPPQGVLHVPRATSSPIR